MRWRWDSWLERAVKTVETRSPERIARVGRGFPHNRRRPRWFPRQTTQGARGVMDVRDWAPGRPGPIAGYRDPCPWGSRVASRRRMTEKLAAAPATLPSAPQDGSVLDFGLRGMDDFQVFRHAIAPQLVMSVTRGTHLLVLDCPD